QEELKNMSKAFRRAGAVCLLASLMFGSGMLDSGALARDPSAVEQIVSGRYYWLTAQCSRLRLDVLDGSTQSGARIDQAYPNNTGAQKLDPEVLHRLRLIINIMQKTNKTQKEPNKTQRKIETFACSLSPNT